MKKLLSMILVAVMVLALGGYALADDPVEITFWSMWNEGEPQATVIAEAAEAYEAETGVRVNIEWRGRTGRPHRPLPESFAYPSDPDEPAAAVRPLPR